MSKVACANCGHVGWPRTRYTGSFLVELVLLCAYVVPGLLYALLFRHAYPVCACCGSRALLKVKSPLGHALQSEMTRDAMRERRRWR